MKPMATLARTAILTVLFFAMKESAALAASTDIPASDEAAIQQLEAQIVVSQNSCERGGKTFASFFLPQGEYVSITGQRYSGRNEIEKATSCNSDNASLSHKIFRFRSMLLGSKNDVRVRTVVVIPSLKGGTIQTPIVGGSFVDELVQTSDGWRIKSRTFHPNQRE